MTATEVEAAGWDHVVDQLAAEVDPESVPPATVRRLVLAEAERLTGARVQAYREVLVARAARRRLRLVAAGADPEGDGGPPERRDQASSARPRW